MPTIRIDESRTVREGTVTITTTAEPLEIDLNVRELARGPAQALRDSIVEALEATAQTQPKLAHGIKWLLGGLVVREVSAGVHEITVPGPSAALVAALVRHVSALREPFESPRVKAALEKAAAGIVRRLRR